MSEMLKPCPFCNRALEHDTNICSTFHPTIPYEEYCPLQSFSFASDRRDIISAWNARCSAVSEQDYQAVPWPNGCNETVPKALRYLAEHDRPCGGQQSFNAEHLYQLASEIERMSKAQLYRKVIGYAPTGAPRTEPQTAPSMLCGVCGEWHQEAADARCQAVSAPSDDAINAYLKNAGEWVEPFTAERECGVAIECDMSQDAADYINAEARDKIREIFIALTRPLRADADKHSPQDSEQ